MALLTSTLIFNLSTPPKVYPIRVLQWWNRAYLRRDIVAMFVSSSSLKTVLFIIFHECLSPIEYVLCRVHAYCPWMSEEGTNGLELELKMYCQPRCRCNRVNPGPLAEP